MITERLNNTQRLVCTRYDSMEELLQRKHYIEKTLQNYLKRTESNEYIEGSYISMAPHHFLFNIVLTKED